MTEELWSTGESIAREPDHLNIHRRPHSAIILSSVSLSGDPLAKLPVAQKLAVVATLDEVSLLFSTLTSNMINHENSFTFRISSQSPEIH